MLQFFFACEKFLVYIIHVLPMIVKLDELNTLMFIYMDIQINLGHYDIHIKLDNRYILVYLID